MHHGHGRSSAGAGFYLEEEDEDFSAGRSGGGPSRGQGAYGSSHSGPSRTRSMSESFEQNDYKEETEVAELLTKAAVTANDQVKLENLARVKEITVNRQPALLDNFLDEMLNFLLDNSPHVRRYILEFIEEACKTDSEIIPKILHNMQIMLGDPVVSVQKKAIQVTGKIYRLTLMWLCRSKTVTEEMENAWSTVNDLKRLIIKLIDSDNDGIRTHTVKFIETVILLQTATEPDSVSRVNEFSLDNVPITVKVARHRRLEEDARSLFDELLKFHGSRHATSVNLMTCMGSLVIISKLRPNFMGRVVTAIEKLNAILPPTLERSQVQSVRKHMKLQLIGLLKHPRAVDYYDNITTLLTDLGASYHDLSKAIPNWDEIRTERRKRQREEKEESSRKRAKVVVEEEVEEEEEEAPVVIEEDYDDEDEDEEVERPRQPAKKASEEASQADEVEKLVFEKLTPSMVADLVIAFMDRLPDTIPAHFASAYTPVAIAGQDTQIRHVARLLSAQITVHQQAASGSRPAGYREYGVDADNAESVITEAPIPTLVSNAPMIIIPTKEQVPAASKALGVGGKKKVLKAVKLSEVTKPMSEFNKQKQVLDALKRIMDTGETLNEVKSDLVSSIAISSPMQLRFFVMQYIREDIKTRLDLGLRWIFGEYSLCQGFLNKAIPVMEDSCTERYEWTFLNLMTGILENAGEADKSTLSWRLYMEPPMIPDRGVDLLKTLCGQANQSLKGMQLLFELIKQRPKKLHYMSALLDFCAHSFDEVRGNAVSVVLKLYEAKEGVQIIEDKAINTYLGSLTLPKPPEILFGEGLGRPVFQPEWTEELVKSSGHLYFQLVTVKNSLIHELAKIYIDTSADVKRTILRQVEAPVRKMGMNSPELMKLLDTFPKGAETLVTRVIHILTDKTLPSAELVSRVKNLYVKRVSDVRFLIPVLNGLTKAEIIAALPKLIKLNPNVVKEVFNRLLEIHADAKSQHKSPISPVELMVELHCMESSKCDVKTIIKATSLCFNESDVFTAETLASVITQLVEKDPFPTLLMRTVIQSLALHPKLSGFVMGTLSRLVMKQVWTQPKVWEGFIKCCQRTIPKSAPIILKLPAAQLRQVLDGAPDLREPLARQLMSMTREQRGCLPSAVREAVLGAEEAYLMKSEMFYDDYGDEISTLGEVHSNHTMSMSLNPVLLKLEPRSPSAIKDEPMEYQHTDD